MKNTQSPISTGKAPQPVANTDYSFAYDRIKAEEDEKAKDQRELPFEINSFPQILGDMVAKVDDMVNVLSAAQNTPQLQDKLIGSQLEKLAKLKELIFDLNHSIYDLKL